MATYILYIQVCTVQLGSTQSYLLCHIQYLHAYKCTCIQVYMHTSVHTYVQVYMCTCVHAHIAVHISLCIRTVYSYVGLSMGLRIYMHRNVILCIPNLFVLQR